MMMMCDVPKQAARMLPIHCLSDLNYHPRLVVVVLVKNS